MKLKSITKTSLVISGIISLVFLIQACKKDEKVDPDDTMLFEMSRSADGFKWFKNSPAFLAKSAGSGHTQALLRVRYNATAAAQLDSNGRIIAGSVFPEGSLIVKELIEQSGVLARYAILYKQKDHRYADAKGWVWGYINVDGSVAETAANKGEACSSCHSQSANIDYQLMNKYFP
ncbi:MAG: cytochrome P460 family protein [Bacteroidetes bacterium]|nr:cytochrome P460 family protein [Bacteroidota bacterium]MBK9798245.1 cytochrome P460 family protein [Bacteroidota bacterium]MBP6412966.1 cytochrome P460 family protein [Bacteroidia bacterium]